MPTLGPCDVTMRAILPEAQPRLFLPRSALARALPKNRGSQNGHSPEVEEVLTRAYGRIQEMWDRPETIPVIFGDPRAPYIRLDPYFMDPPEDPVAHETFAELTRQIGI